MDARPRQPAERPPGGRLLFMYAGVFFTFATVGLFFLMITQPPGTIGAALIIGSFSGTIALCWAASFVQGRRRYLLIVVPVTFLIPLFILPLLGRSGVLGIGGSLTAIQRGMTLAISSIFLLSIGYIFTIRYVRDMEQHAARVRAEVELAAKLHRTIVPTIDRQIGTLSIYGVSLPSSEVGGDLIDLIVHGDGTVDLLLADVSGHGIRAGMAMGMLKAMARISATPAQSPAALLSRLSAGLAELTAPGMFATAAALRLRPLAEGHSAEMCLAGHWPLLYVAAGAASCTRLDGDNPPLGVVDELVCTGSQAEIGPGSTLVLLTDGLIEVRNQRGQQLGFDALCEVACTLAMTPGMTARAMAEALLAKVAAHGPRDDDQTLIVIRA